MDLDKELITENPFAILVRRMNRIEYQNEQILSFLQGKERQATTDTTPYGNFDWLLTVLPIPKSTLRQKIARDEIPGVKKVGKRLVFEKDTVLNWIATNQKTSSAEIYQFAESQFNTYHQRKGGRKTA